MNKDQLICLLKAEIQDLQDQIEAMGVSGPASAISPECGASLDLRAYTGRLVAEALRRAGNNKTRAAKLLGVERSTMYSILKSNHTHRCHVVPLIPNKGAA